jgi:hypothetical protein
MNILLKLEELAVFVLCIVLFNQLSFAWWWFPALILLPDLSMLGYIINPKTGAYCYNLLHHRGIAMLVAVYGIASRQDSWILAAIILFAHIALDRAMGYGLKYNNSFGNTHLGKVGKIK